MILDGSFPPDPRVENEAVMLVQHGYEVHLYCLDYTNSAERYELIKGIHVHRQRAGKMLHRLSALAYTIPLYHLLLLRSIDAFIRKSGVRILHIHDIQSARAVFWVNRRRKLPVFLDLHENRPEIMKYYTHVNSFPGRFTIFPSLWKKFEYRYIRKADKVIVVTKEAREHYLQRIGVDPAKFFVVPNTVRKEFYTKFTLDETIINRYKQSFVVLYIGETGVRRGIETIIKAAALLRNKIPELKMVIVGKSRADASYQKLIAETGVAELVELVGWQDQSLFQSYIHSSAIGVCPLHKNLHHETTYANKIFMYLAFGKPIVVSDCLAQANVVREYECGLISKEKDEDDFAGQVLKLYEDKELYHNYSVNAERAVRETLNWEEKSKELLQLYEDYDRKGI